MQHLWGRRDIHTGFRWGNTREGNYLEDPGIDGRIILKWIFETWDMGMSWINVARDRDKWRAVVIAVMNLRVA
jgi:hypothetical protein